MSEHFDIVAAGSSFATMMFLQRYLEGASATARVLVLEAGPQESHAERVASRRVRGGAFDSEVTNASGEGKEWYVAMAVGGGSNRWSGCTPRFLPNDFRMQSTYGVGVDWPITYDELEPYYCDAEDLLGVAGDSENVVARRSRPYPLPPHRLTDPDRLIQVAYPGLFHAQPCARPSVAHNGRPRCCSSGVCPLCPIDSKFRVETGLRSVFDDPRIEVRATCPVEAVVTEGGVATGVTYLADGAPVEVTCDLVVLGASAVFNPVILQRSGLGHPQLGVGIHEQVGRTVTLLLDGVDNFQGSTMITGQGYMFYDGPHRAERAGVIMETFNIPMLRPTEGRWRQVLMLRLVAEDLRQESNRVDAVGDQVRIVHPSRTPYATDGLDAAVNALPAVLDCLPIEDIEVGAIDPTEFHVVGTTVMGADSSTSVIDATMRLHSVPNVVVLGAGAFPTSSPSNPTLTLSALSLMAADRL